MIIYTLVKIKPHDDTTKAWSAVFTRSRDIVSVISLYWSSWSIIIFVIITVSQQSSKFQTSFDGSTKAYLHSATLCLTHLLWCRHSGADPYGRFAKNCSKMVSKFFRLKWHHRFIAKTFHVKTYHTPEVVEHLIPHSLPSQVHHQFTPNFSLNLPPE